MDAISAMVAPVVLITMGSLVCNGLTLAAAAVHDYMRYLRDQQFDLCTAPGGELLDAAGVPTASQARLSEIDQQLPLVLWRFRLIQRALVLVYAGIAVLVLSVIAIAVAVTSGSQPGGDIALALVLAGVLVEFAGILTGGWSAATTNPLASAIEQKGRLP